MADVSEEFIPHVSIPYENTYAGVMDAIARYYGKDSIQYEAINQYGLSNPAASSILRQMGYDVTVNGKGEVTMYTMKGTGITSTGDKVASDLINSNNQTGTASASNTAAFNVVGDVVRDGGTAAGAIKATTKIAKWKDGVKTVMNTPVAGKVGPAILAAQTGIQLAHVVDGGIYHIGKAMGADPPESLNPDSWASITSDMSDEGWEGVSKWAFNTIFDIDTDNKTATMYADENAVSYMAWYLQHAGWFNTGADEYKEYTNSEYQLSYPNRIKFPMQVTNSFSITRTISGVQYTYSYYSSAPMAVFIKGHTAQFFTASNSNFTWGYTDATGSNSLTVSKYNDAGEYYGGYTARSWGTNETPSFVGAYNEVPEASFPIAADIYKILLYGNRVTISGAPDGVEQGKTSDGQTAKNYDSQLADADSQEKMLELLKTLYPELWDNRIENTVAQDDGTEKTFVYIPLPMPTGGTGDNPEGGVVPDAGTVPAYGTGTAGATDTQIGTLIKWLTQTLTPTGEVEPDPTGTGQPDYDPTGMVNPKTGVDPETGKPTTGGTPNPPDTGGGDTPVVVLPEGHANALYAIYNPTQSQLNSLGAWLWSSDFVDQLLKLFSDPMQAIIGLHKIYATPATGGEQNIKVGFLDSGVSSKIVTDQYTTVDCGSINLFEYFGNVFDYAPYTQLRLYLPFIGIVNLDTEDAMRGVIHVVYHVDVLSGACLAEVRITRDAAGGTLYQYAGNAAVTMPISSGSYIGVIANVVGVASSAIGGFASGGVAGGIAGGVTGALTRRGGTQVQHSGNFSGNAGAMGIKKPYLIIERPQTALADNYAEYIGNPSNTTVTLSSCTGYIKMKEVHLENVPATGAELSEIEQTLKQGVII